MNKVIYDVRDSIEHNIKHVYNYGSKVYGTNSNESDDDFIVIVKAYEELDYSVFGKDADCKVYSEKTFINKIQQHKISALECIFQNEYDSYRNYFKLDLEKLRHEISSVSSNSYVKCKKKLKDGEVRIGLKSLFHSIRILLFGIQIAKYGKIVDYTEANHYQNQIFEIGDNWELLHEAFKPIHNELKSEFRLLTPLIKYKERL